jgi:hypothetical protein
MSGPFGVGITIISGQKHSGEIAVAASTLLSMGFLSINLVGTDIDVRPEFINAIDVYIRREHIDCRERPVNFVSKLKQATNEAPIYDMFWLALDPEGEAIARNILDARSEPANKRVYHSVQKLNLIDPVVSPLPAATMPLTDWVKSRVKHFGLLVKFDRKGKESYSSYMNRNAPLSDVEEMYHRWFDALYMSLIPWQDTIRNIQSDYS